MPRKSTNLAAALAKTDETKAAESPTVEKTNAVSQPSRTPSRVGKANISGWFNMPVKHALDELRLQQARERDGRVTVQDLLEEAMNDLFKKYGMPELAPGREGR